MVASFPALLHGLARQIGASDCEELGDDYLVQPINAVTSLSYTAVGIGIAIVAWRRRRSPVESTVFALCLVAIGLGSVAFHGPQPTGSRIVHDLPILLTVLFIVVHDARLLAPRLDRWMWPMFVGGSIIGTIVTTIDQDVAGILTGVLVVTAVVEEFFVYRRRLRPEPDRRQRPIVVALVVMAVLSGATWVLGRTDSPLCDPDGVVQFHAIWHVGSAILFVLWWMLAFGPGADEPADELVHAEAAPN